MLSRRITTAVALLLSLFAPSFSAHAQTRRALLIGIDRYSVPEGKLGAREGRGTWRDLHGCVNDAEAMASLLETRYGFKHENIELLEDRAAEREVILSRIRARLIDPAKPHDVREAGNWGRVCGWGMEISSKRGQAASTTSRGLRSPGSPWRHSDIDRAAGARLGEQHVAIPLSGHVTGSVLPSGLVVRRSGRLRAEARRARGLGRAARIVA